VIIGHKQSRNIDAKRPGKKGNFQIPEAMSLAFNTCHHFPPHVKAAQLEPFREFGLRPTLRHTQSLYVRPGHVCRKFCPLQFSTFRFHNLISTRVPLK
jgi:hypothetical protein